MAIGQTLWQSAIYISQHRLIRDLCQIKPRKITNFALFEPLIIYRRQWWEVIHQMALHQMALHQGAVLRQGFSSCNLL